MLSRSFFQRSLIPAGCLALCCSVLAGIPGEGFGQEWARKMFTEFNHDFGNVAKGSFVEYKFPIKNIYEEDIRIESAVSSCGCAQVSLSTNRLKTWETGYVVAKFNTQAFSGFRQATITVRFARPFLGEVQLNVRGNIRSDVTFQPGSINFGPLPLTSEDKSKSIRISKFGNPNWRIVDVKSTYQHIKVRLSPPTQVGTSVDYEMTVRLTDTVPVGFVNGELYIVAEERGRRFEIPISFSGNILAPLRISPEVLVFNATPGQEETRKLVITGNQPFAITAITSSDATIQIAPTDQTKKVHIVEARLKAPQVSGEYKGEITIETDLPGGAVQKMETTIQVSDQ
ncbi:MAG: DUF1573 domain-containing protein [Mariniblastus sp.]|nr:DUF1573 domain-containing protein [Mariniblastus sp.]